MRTIFWKGSEYKQGLNDLFYYKASLNEWNKASNQKQIAKLWAEKQHKDLESDDRLLQLLKISGPLTATQITNRLNMSLSGGKSFVARLKRLGLVESKGFFKGNAGNGRSPVIWGLVA